MITLKYCTVLWLPYGAVTRFLDTSAIETFPHDTPHYRVVAQRCGYGDDRLSYCREHDFFHSFCEEWFHDRPSPVLWALAHGQKAAAPAYEEIVVQACQRWVRSNERPIIGGVDWDGFRHRAITLLLPGQVRERA